LDTRYFDAWLNAAIEIGIFKVDVDNTRVFKTEPHIYDFLINEENPFFFGDLYGSIIRMAINHEKILANFKTGEILDRNTIPEDIIMDGHRTTARMGRKLMHYYTKNFPAHHQHVIQGGSILELGCGYGFNLINWATIYNKSRIIGIDPDDKAIEYTKKVVLENGLIVG